MTTNKTDHTDSEKKSPVPFSIKNPKKIILGVVLLLVIAGGAAWYYRDALPSELASLFMQDEAAATVNGKKVSKAELDRRIAVAQAQGQEVSDEMQKQLLDQMVNEEVIFQTAEADGLTTTPEEVEAQYAEIIQSFPSEQEFQTALAEEQLTEQKLKSNVSRQIILNQYFEKLQQDNPVEVSAEETMAYYEQSVASMEEAPAFEEVQGQIEQQLQQQKFNEIAIAHIEALRSKADIKILI